MPWQLSDIRRKVRQVTGRLSSNSLSTQQLDEYINNYYQFTFPAEVKLERQHTFYEFLTVPNQQEYTFPNTTYTNVEPPLYINQRPLLYYQDPVVFKNENPMRVSPSTPWTGDAVIVAFTTTLQFPYILPLSVIITDNTETFTDDGAGLLIGDLGGTGTVVYTTGVINVTFNAAPANGQDIYLTVTQYQPGIPTSVLLYDNIFSLYPVPDTVYRCQIKAYKIVTALVNATDAPVLEEWGECIAYGASRDIVIDFGESERYGEITQLYKEQVDYILTRTVQNLSNERARPMW